MSVWDFSGLKDIFQVFDQFVILSRSKEIMRLVPVCLKEKGCHVLGWSHQQRDKDDFPESQRDLR